MGTSLITLDNKFNTTLAFVSLMDDGERDFVFFRGADVNLKIPDKNALRNFEIFHFGSATAFLGGKLEKTYFEIFEFAKENNKFISFDVNYRSDLWKDPKKLISLSKKIIEHTDFAKFSEEELFLFSGNRDLEESINYIHEIGAKVVAVTLGKKGSILSDGNNVKQIDSIDVEVVDSTGAGDAFVGHFCIRFRRGKGLF